MVLLTRIELPVVLKVDLYYSFFLWGGGGPSPKDSSWPSVIFSLSAQNIHKRTHQYRLNFALFFDNLTKRIR